MRILTTIQNFINDLLFPWEDVVVVLHKRPGIIIRWRVVLISGFIDNFQLLGADDHLSGLRIALFANRENCLRQIL